MRYAIFYLTVVGHSDFGAGGVYLALGTEGGNGFADSLTIGDKVTVQFLPVTDR
jgi:hypothetical protein